MSARDREELIELAAAAWRPRDRDGRPRGHAAWHDLDAEARVEAYELGMRQRALEAAIDPDGLSTTARAVLARITGGQP